MGPINNLWAALLSVDLTDNGCWEPLIELAAEAT